MKVYAYEVPLSVALHHFDIKIKVCCTKIISRSFLTRLCAYNRLRYQVSVYRTIGHLVLPVTIERLQSLLQTKKTA